MVAKKGNQKEYVRVATMAYSKESAKDYLKGNETGYQKERIKVDLEANLVSLHVFANHRCTIAPSGS